MTRKQQKQERNKRRRLVRTVEEVIKIIDVKDICPYTFPNEELGTEGCCEPYCPVRLSGFENCERYRMGTPRINTNSPMLYEHNI